MKYIIFRTTDDGWQEWYHSHTDAYPMWAGRSLATQYTQDQAVRLLEIIVWTLQPDWAVGITRIDDTRIVAA